MLHDFVIDNVVHELVSFDRLFLRDSNVLLFQRHGTEAGKKMINKSQSPGSVHPLSHLTIPLVISSTQNDAENYQNLKTSTIQGEGWFWK